jgi:hypothetical protein
MPTNKEEVGERAVSARKPPFTVFDTLFGNFSLGRAIFTRVIGDT